VHVDNVVAFQSAVQYETADRKLQSPDCKEDDDEAAHALVLTTESFKELIYTSEGAQLERVITAEER
jgi:hypothetical protein